MGEKELTTEVTEAKIESAEEGLVLRSAFLCGLIFFLCVLCGSLS